MTSASAPNPVRVFVSHASEDKDRFVIPFATRLRSDGVDAWVDKWEIRVGDSLVQRIFVEGIDECDVFVVVLSQFSISKPWVTAELNTAVVRRIQSQTRLIPIVLDNCKVPVFLNDTKWQKITDTDRFSTEYEQILIGILEGQNPEKPPLGQAPAYSKVAVGLIEGLDQMDSQVFKAVCDIATASENSYVHVVELAKHADLLDLPSAKLNECLEMIQTKGCATLLRTSGGIYGLTVDVAGYERYAAALIPEYHTLASRVAACLVNLNHSTNSQVASELKVERHHVTHVFRLLEMNGYLMMSALGRAEKNVRIKPHLARLLQQ